MKISLKLANGATLDFEGDAAEFERLSAFLAEPPESMTADAPAAEPRTEPAAPDGPQPANADALEPANVAQRLEHVGARNDQERVTVMAQLAVDQGGDGIDYPTLNSLYTELGVAKPAQFPTKTLANAKSSGLMRMVKQGLWKPTFRGENFAQGFGRGERQTRRPPARPREVHSEEGGSSD